MSDTIKVSIVGGSGYVGGELLRLLLFHPHVEIGQITSVSQTGKFVHNAHPNLREVTSLKFSHPDNLEPCDLLFLGQPHGYAAKHIEQFTGLASRIIDTSADFRLHDPVVYKKWYGEPHPAPDWLGKFVYGLPEKHRAELAGANYASGVGCNATVTNLALAPLAEAGLLEGGQVVADVKVGSSEGGARPNDGSHHPERSGSVRSFKPTGHRHQAEIRQLLGHNFELYMSVTSIEMIRGALVTAHCILNQKVTDKDLWKLYRKAYKPEPFVRLVKQRTGIFRYPDPKLLPGTNFCDVGFEAEANSNRVVVIGALDNLMKGAAGSAVQTMNAMLGWPETTGLTFPGLHPL
ncbi:N-acetyl-gamma-glutamyl-phosphate reductase [Anaerolineales bacterium HSG6]|nr:N-acetyl-gamma-glutamyl-phosphate reductase [Anaerolineales bacterium HSG6]